jgi:hypothetical protein
MLKALPQTLPNVFEGRRGSKGGDLIRKLQQKGQVTNPNIFSQEENANSYRFHFENGIS